MSSSPLENRFEPLLRAWQTCAEVHVEDVLDALWLATRDRSLQLHSASRAEAVMPVSALAAPADELPPTAATVTAPDVSPQPAGSETASDSATEVFAGGQMVPGTEKVRASPVTLPAGRAVGSSAPESGTAPLSAALAVQQRTGA